MTEKQWRRTLTNGSDVKLYFRTLSQKMIQTLEVAAGDVESLKECAALVNTAVYAAAGDPGPVQEELTAVNQQYSDLQQKLRAREEEVEKALERGTRLRHTMEAIKAWALETLGTIEAWAPASTDAESASKQLRELEVSYPWCCFHACVQHIQ